MNLHAIAVPAVATVNPMIIGTVKTSTGFSTASDGTRTPTYSTATGVPLQVQALDARELAQLDGINIEGLRRKIYINADVQGVDRKQGKGGDLIIFNGQTWLVVVVFETWDADGPWCSVGVVLQVD